MKINPYIDHTVLKPTTRTGDVTRLCTEAATNGFASVCVPPPYVNLAVDLLKITPVLIGTVIGFPFGYNTTEAKLIEIQDALANGAHEFDIVHNLTMLKNKDWYAMQSEIAVCTQLVHKHGAVVKIIVESGILTDEEIIKCCELYSPLKINFMKTSTGYSSMGATVHAVKLMREHLPANIAIKASGGIRNFAFAKELIDAGATRIGCSASLQIVKESNE